MPETMMTAEPGNDRRVNSMIKPVRRGLVREEDAEYRDEDRAAGQQRSSPGTD